MVKSYRFSKGLTIVQLFSIAYTIAINEQVEYGLGSPLRTLSDSEYNSFQAAGYASNILFITGLFFAKASTLTLIIALAPNKKYRMPAKAVGVFLLVWTVASILASAFQCTPPKTWLYTSGECFDQTSFWVAYAVIDMLTDLVIMCLPILLLYKLQLPLSKKVNVCFAFSFRLLAIGCTVFRIIELPKLFHRNSDVTLDSWLPTIATILELFASVFATCVPHLRPFMESIQAGYLSGIAEGSNDARYAYGNGSYLMGKMSRNKEATTVSSNVIKDEPKTPASLDLPRHGVRADEDRVGQAVTTSGEQKRSTSSDGHRSHDSTGSKAMIIK